MLLVLYILSKTQAPLKSNNTRKGAKKQFLEEPEKHKDM